MDVKAKKGLEFWCQGKKATPENSISVQLNHDIRQKLRDGSLIEVQKKIEKRSA